MLQNQPKRSAASLSGVLAATLLTVGLTASPSFADELPSAAEIKAAQDNASDTAALVSDIEGILQEAAVELQDAQVEAMKSQGAYVDALAELDERRATARRLKAEAAKAEEFHQSAASEVGKLAADIYRAGGIMPDTTLLAFAQDPGSIMYQASTVEGLAASRTRTVNEAQTAAKSLGSLREDSRQAEEAAAEAATAAEKAGEATETAMAAATELVEKKQAERATLIEQLAVLRDTTAALEEERISGLEQRRREEELARVLAASAEAAAAAPATSTSSAPSAQPNVPSLLPPPASDPALPAPQPEAPVAPAPNPASPAPRPTPPAPAPQPPAPRPPAPAPPAPRPPAPAPQPPAQAPAPAPKPPAPAPPPPPATNPGGIAAAVQYARARVGAPYYYAWGGNGPRGYDCSGLVQQAFASAGISVPRTASQQFYAARTHVPLSQAQFGDLVFWGEGAGIWHVAIYVGNNTVVNALNPEQGILEVNLANMSGMGALNPMAARF